MTSDELSHASLIAFLSYGLALAALNLIGASWYDVVQTKRRRQILAHPHARGLRRRPLISVIIQARNDELVIEKCLDSLIKSRYRKYEIIVVDMASSDFTKKKTRAFGAAHPSASLRLVAKRQKSPWPELINGTLQKYAKGELIMLLKADQAASQQALANIAWHFNTQKIEALAANLQPTAQPSLGAVFEQIEYLVVAQARKLKIFNRPASEFGLVFRRSVASPPGLAKGQFYASDVLIYKPPARSILKAYKQYLSHQLRRLEGSLASLLNIGRQQPWLLPKAAISLLAGVLRLSAPIFIGYFIYLAVWLKYPLPLALSWTAGVGFLWLTIWSADHISVYQKMRLSFLAPIMGSFFYLASLMPIVAILGFILYSLKKIIVRAFRKIGRQTLEAKKLAA